MPIYNNPRRLDSALKNLEEIDITEKNKQDIKDFLHYYINFTNTIFKKSLTL